MAEQNEGIVILILQVTIVEAHRKAVNNGHFTYDDPTTGLKVTFRPDWELILPFGKIKLSPTQPDLR